MKKRLYRSQENKVFAGVMGGLGEYFDVDPVVLRLLWLFIVIFTGVVPGVIVYLFAIFIIPRQGERRGDTPMSAVDRIIDDAKGTV